MRRHSLKVMKELSKKIGVGRRNATNIPGVGKVWKVNDRYRRAANPRPASKRAKTALYRALGGTIKRK